MAVLDYSYKAVGGFLAFMCFFQLLEMLRKIRRVLIFTQMLGSAVTLFYMPLMTGVAFSSTAFLLFGSTINNFSSIVISYLVVNQYFIKPQALFHSLTESHPYIGPWFVFCLGFCINFFIVNFFIVFLNEAYSSIINKIRLLTYKKRQKSKLEYVYEFLGFQTTSFHDSHEDTEREDPTGNKDLIVRNKRLFYN
ncbi:hypothetical protein EGW08_004628 [Elysia chlorotica]|uniref:Polycystin cation channel PKD1/PKD2 domain-containing protein n=1 Tax=Elysia chlorotica TaxID=188477 RepID=A0A3S0ZWB4_ELYCH|nr:hypothetical protein EGW08_004628 [Elysia chlorotica]